MVRWQFRNILYVYVSIICVSSHLTHVSYRSDNHLSCIACMTFRVIDEQQTYYLEGR